MSIADAGPATPSATSRPDSADERRSPLDVVVPAGIFLAASALYVETMTPGLGGGIDSTELQQAAYTLSIVHPTGYPLYLLLTRAFITLVPFGEPAWRVTLFSALCGAAAIVLVYLVTALLTRSRLAGAFAAGLAATHPLIWPQATIAEVNSLNLLLVAGLFYVLLRWAQGSPERPGAPLELAGLLFGLALANHRVSLLALPGVVVFVAWSVREGARLSRPSLARTVGAALLPLLLYLYIPLRDGTTAWYSNSWDNFWHVAGGESAWPVIRETIQRPLLPRVRIVFEAVFGERGATAREGRLAGLLSLGGLALLALAAPVWWRDSLQRRAIAGLLAPTAAIVAGVMVVYDVDVIGDYLSMAALTVAILAACGVAAVIDWLRSFDAARETSRAAVVRVASVAVWALLLYGVIWHGSTIQPWMDRSDDDSAELFWDEVRSWQGTPDELEQGALLISPWHRYNELLYLQAVEDWRPDLEPVVLDDIVAGNRLDLIDEWLAQGRPVYLLESTPAVLDHFLAEGQAGIWRITARGQLAEATMERPLDIRFGDDVTLLGYALDPEPVAPGGLLRITLFWRAEAPIEERYVVFSHLLDGSGAMVGQRDDEPGRGQRPTIGWPPGETIVDSLLLPIDPAATPGPHRLMIGLYTRVGETRLPAFGPDGEALGDYWQMAEIEVGF